MINFQTTTPPVLTSTHPLSVSPPSSPRASTDDPAQFKPYKSHPIVSRLSFPASHAGRRRSFGTNDLPGGGSAGMGWEFVLNGVVWLTAASCYSTSLTPKPPTDLRSLSQETIQFNIAPPAPFKRPISSLPPVSSHAPLSPTSPDLQPKKRFSFSFGSPPASSRETPSDVLNLEQTIVPGTGVRTLRMKSVSGAMETAPAQQSVKPEEAPTGKRLSFSHFLPGTRPVGLSEQGGEEEAVEDSGETMVDEALGVSNLREGAAAGGEWPLSIKSLPLTHFQIPLSAITSSSQIAFFPSKPLPGSSFPQGKTSARTPAIVVVDIPGDPSKQGEEEYEGRVRVEFDFEDLFSGDPEAQTLYQTLLHHLYPTAAISPGGGASKAGPSSGPSGSSLMRGLSLGRVRSVDKKKEEDEHGPAPAAKGGWFGGFVDSMVHGKGK